MRAFERGSSTSGKLIIHIPKVRHKRLNFEVGLKQFSINGQKIRLYNLGSYSSLKIAFATEVI